MGCTIKPKLCQSLLLRLSYPNSSIVVDSENEEADIPDFPWIRGDDLYSKLRQDYRM